MAHAGNEVSGLGDGLPNLPRGCNSWVVSAPDGRRFELYERASARKALAAGWLVETSLDYLSRLNQEIRASAEVSA